MVRHTMVEALIKRLDVKIEPIDDAATIPSPGGGSLSLAPMIEFDNKGKASLVLLVLLV